MDSAEFSEWLAYSQIEPLPDLYWVGAMICRTIARSLGGSKAELKDFLPRTRPAARQSGRSMFEIMRAKMRQARGDKAQWL